MEHTIGKTQGLVVDRIGPSRITKRMGMDWRDLQRCVWEVLEEREG